MSYKERKIRSNCNHIFTQKSWYLAAGIRRLAVANLSVQQQSRSILRVGKANVVDRAFRRLEIWMFGSPCPSCFASRFGPMGRISAQTLDPTLEDGNESAPHDRASASHMAASAVRSRAGAHVAVEPPTGVLQRLEDGPTPSACWDRH